MEDNNKIKQITILPTFFRGEKCLSLQRIYKREVPK